MTSHTTAKRFAAALSICCVGFVGCGSSDDPPTADLAPESILVQAPSAPGDSVSLLQPDGTVGAPLDSRDTITKHADWSPDGTTIAYVDDADGSLWTMSADGSNATQVLACGDDCFYLDFPAFSPDGRRLAYTRYEAPAGDGPPSASSINVLDLGSGDSTEVTSAEQPELVDVPRWSPDGTQLVIGIDVFDEAFNEVGSTIGVVAVEGGEVRRLLEDSTFAYGPDWNTDDLIVFSTETMQFRADPQIDDGAWNLWTIRPDGSDATTVTDVEAGTQLIQPSWSPDGQLIVATAQQRGIGTTRRVIAVDPDSGTVTTISTQIATHPRVRPSPD